MGIFRPHHRYKSIIDSKGGKAYLPGMSDDILNTIEVLSNRVRLREEETNKLKKLINELCGEASIPAKYSNVATNGSGAPIRADEFYGQTLTAAIRNYLERRK